MPNEIKDLSVEQIKDMSRNGALVDDSLFKEERSNIRLYRGDHYIKRGNQLDGAGARTKTRKSIDRAQLRITMNHIHKICNIYSNEISNIAPSVSIAPANSREESDMKVADMHQRLWSNIKEKHNVKYINRRHVDNFVIIGEVFCKVFWNPSKGMKIPGKIKQDFDVQTGEPVGEPYQEMKMSGDVDYETMFGYNMKRDPSATEWSKCRWVMYDKMVDTSDVEKQFGVKLKHSDTVDETFKIFDANTAGYFEMVNKQNKVLIRELFFRPCLEYPDGYYYISTDQEILSQGKLPLGQFPIFNAFFDEVPGSPRGYSIIKQARSSQAEINRTVSKIAEHQVTLGDDTVYIQKGTKIAPGGFTNGVKAVQYSGIEPKVVQGRSGTQYVEHLDKTIENMYRILDIGEFAQKPGSQDIMSQLYKNLREKEKFTKYAEKIERFQRDMCRFTLKLYKHLAPDEMLVEIIGLDELDNIKEFRQKTDLSYQIKLDDVTEDIDTKFAKMTKFMEILQYRQDMTPQQSGLIIKNIPFVNIDEISKELTRPYEVAQNVKLKLDRGEWSEPRGREDHDYMIDVLSARTLENDYKYLPEQIHQMYEQRIQMHEQAKVEQVQRQQELNAGFIPTGGDLVSVNMSISVPSASGGVKTEKLKLPIETINWVRDMLSKQGFLQEQISQILPEGQAEMGDIIGGGQQGNPGDQIV